jgi:hypothetical protein
MSTHDYELKDISDVTFGQSTYDVQEQEMVNKNNYTVIDADHLDEDDDIPGQRYCLLSFMSPEGIMNCNTRAVKFRGAFATLEEAEKYAAKLEQQDAYFKIFVGETGKWLPCDPNSDKVEQEKTSNPQHQQILDAQAKQRMAKINELAGRTKQLADKNNRGRKDMMNEKKKEGAAQEIVDKKRQQKNTNTHKQVPHGSKSKLEAMKDRMRKKLAEKQKTNKIPDNLSNKLEIVSKNSKEVENNLAKLETVDRNIDRIKQLMAQRKNN